MSPFYFVLLQEYNTTCSGATKCRRRPGAPKLPPDPPFFDKHALKNLKVSLRVTITHKNVIIGTPGGKIFKK